MAILEIAANAVTPAEESTMRRIASLATFWFLLLCFFTAAPSARAQLAHNSGLGPSAAPADRWTICFVQGASTSTDRGVRTPIYVSATMHTVPPENYQDVDRAFGQFITKKFLPAGMTASGARCWSALSAAEAQRAIKQPGDNPAPGQAIDLDCTRWDSQCVMTGWNYLPPSQPDSQPATQPAAAAPRPADPCVISGVGMATAPPAGCRPTVTSYTVCYSANNQSTVYISAAFAVTSMDNPAWTNGFTDFLAQKYSYQGDGIGCNNMSSSNAPTFLKNRIAALRASHKEVVETGWSFGSAPTAPTAPAAPVATAPAAPAAPAASPAPVTTHANAIHENAAHATPPPAPAAAAPVVHAPPAASYAVCWAEVPSHRTAYFSAPFTFAANFQTARTEYRKFLTSKYGLVGQFNCRALPTLAAAQQQTQTWMNAARAKDAIVDTGWKYE